MAIEESEILNGCKQDYGGPHGISQFSLIAAIRPEKWLSSYDASVKNLPLDRLYCYLSVISLTLSSPPHTKYQPFWLALISFQLSMKLCITWNVWKDNQIFGHMGRQNPKVITIESKRLLSRSESGKTHLAKVNYCLDGVS